MSYLLTSEQKELKDSMRTFLTEQLTSTYLRSRIAEKRASDPELWGKLLEFGFFPYFAGVDPEATGQFRELAILAHEAGRALLTENLIDNLFAGPYALRGQGEDELLHGTKRIAFVFDPTDLNIIHHGAKFLLSGVVRLAPGADADALLFCVGSKLFLGKPSENQDLIKLELEDALDNSIKYCKLTLKDFPCQALTAINGEKLRAAYLTLKACELNGVAERVVEMTVEYVKTRKQFELPVGTFQAVQHRLADMHLKTEALKALCNFAAWSADNSPDQFTLASHAAIGFAQSHVAWIVESALQLHGGIGFTFEYDLHLYLRRAKTIESCLNLNTEDVLQAANP